MCIRDSYKDDEARNNTEAFIAYSTIKTIYAKGDDAGSLECTIKNRKTKEDNEQFEKNYRASINNNHQEMCIRDRLRRELSSICSVC